MPYLIPAEEYNHFNSLYYSSAMLTVISLMGLDFVFARNKPSLKVVLYLLSVNVIVFFIIFTALSGRFEVMILPLLISNIGFSLYTTVLLFQKQLNKYLLASFIYFMIGVSAFTIHKITGIELFILFSVCSLALIPGVILHFDRLERVKIGLSEVYLLGLSVFMINALSGVVFNIDKFIINNYLGINEGNAYTFAWTILVPVFYIGNLYEKQIYTESGSKLPYYRILKISLLNAVSLSVYLFAVNYIFINYNLLPKSVDKDTFAQISQFLSLGLLMFSVVHFPLNGILLKYSSPETQKKSGIINLLVLILFIFTLMMVQALANFSIPILILFSFAALLISSSWKAFLVIREIKSSKSAEDNLSDENSRN